MTETYYVDEVPAEVLDSDPAQYEYDEAESVEWAYDPYEEEVLMDLLADNASLVAGERF